MKISAITSEAHTFYKNRITIYTNRMKQATHRKTKFKYEALVHRYKMLWALWQRDD